MENQEKNEKVEDFTKELQTLKEKYQLDFSVAIDFPDYKVLPSDLQLALAVMSRHRLSYVLGFKDLETKK